MVILATRTKQAITEALERDQGATYRRFLHEAMREAVDLKSDAFRDEEDTFRSHLGASMVGGECPREIWYGFRWATVRKSEARMVRLFNRGHLEEMRFVALLRTIGCQVWQYDEEKHQFRLSDHSGHFGGSLDAVIRGCPDVPDAPILGEFKTHSFKSFEKLVKDGVQESKPKHVVQMQLYMGKFRLEWSLYMAVNKNNDDIHCELIQFNPEVYARYIDRAGQLITAPKPPRKISQSPGWFGCKFCDQRLVCHYNVAPAINCRTCIHSRPINDGAWACSYHNDKALSKQDQLDACPDHSPFTK